ncbi:MAG: alpha/beta hydrolase [Spirochaetes bacterium]|nr:alpha/beta hydrolase [Spirochaetota bacterium]
MINKITGKGRKVPTLWLYLGLFLLLMGGIRFAVPLFVFMPSARIERTPAAINLAYEDIFLRTSDNVQLHAWYIPAPDARATLLFFHGNAGNISHRFSSIQIFHDLGLSVFILSYRGYGQSKGRPSINGTKLDALAAWQWLTVEREIPAEKIVVFGRSLGGAVAMELMRSATPGALILESTFSSLADMSPFPAPIAPLLLGGDFWNSVRTARTLTIPVLCIHSRRDEVVPFRQGRRIYEAITSEKTFLEIQGDHNSGFMQSRGIYVAGLDRFLTQHFGER